MVWTMLSTTPLKLLTRSLHRLKSRVRTEVSAMTKRAREASRDKLAHVLHIDGEIKHLETVLRLQRNNDLFAHDYWKQRIDEAQSTPGLLPAQKKRLDKLRNLLEMFMQRQDLSDRAQP